MVEHSLWERTLLAKGSSRLCTTPAVMLALMLPSRAELAPTGVDAGYQNRCWLILPHALIAICSIPVLAAIPTRSCKLLRSA